MGFNTLIISGNLGRDAETRYTPSNKAIVQFSVPATSGFGDSQKTTWIRCNWFGDRAVKVADYLKKGAGVIVQGEFSLNTYTGKDGIEKSSPELNVRELTLIGGKRNDEHESAKVPVAKSESIVDMEDSIPW